MSRKGGLLVAWFGLGLLCGGLWTDARKVSPERDRAIAAVKARRPPGWRHTLGYHLEQTVILGRRTHHPVRLAWRTLKIGKEWRVINYDQDELATGTATWRVRLRPLLVVPADELARDIETDMKQ